MHVGHLKDSRSSAKNSATRTTLQRKLKKLVGTKVLCSAFFKDLLIEAKKFSLLTQEKNVNIIKFLNAVKSTKSNYKQLLKKIQDSNDYILTLPNFKIVIDAVKPTNIEVNYSRKKLYPLDHAQYIVKKIIYCFDQRYGNLFDISMLLIRLGQHPSASSKSQVNFNF